MSLSKDSTIQEIFNHVYNPDEDVQVVPVTISKKGDDIARLMILIQGKPETSNHIMANLMHQVQEMWDLAEQHSATDASELIGTDGEKLGDDPKAILSSVDG
ncbi:MAG TPA: hypothetical protein ENH10_06835 [Bacteroidetes bacterium]|nr:hypothetical protein [Bacteroidota bacterium]HEX04857.1 hypothetical protein [Bacteroidota bacterium]